MNITNLVVKAVPGGLYVSITVQFDQNTLVDFGAHGETYAEALLAAQQLAVAWGTEHGFPGSL